MKNKYTIPKLNKKSKYWYVYYRYDGVQFRETWKLNKIENLKERESNYNDYIKILLAELKSGWNPNIPILANEKSSLTILESFDLSITNKQGSVSDDTFYNHKNIVDRLKISINKLNLQDAKIVDLKQRHFKIILDCTQKEFKLTDSSYNRYKVNLSTVLNSLVDAEIIKKNYASKIKLKKTTKSVSHLPAAEKEIEKIKKHLYSNYINFYNFWVTMFHTGIRPTELLKVTIDMLDLDNNQFNLPKEITKNKEPRIVPINIHLLSLLKSMRLDAFSVSYYLFGSNNVKFKHAETIESDYSPGIYKIERREATLFWRLEIKEKLNVNMTLYAIKKYGANKKILAGLSVDALRELFGQSSEVTTRIYITNLKEINRKEIMDNSPDF